MFLFTVTLFIFAVGAGQARNCYSCYDYPNFDYEECFQADFPYNNRTCYNEQHLCYVATAKDANGNLVYIDRGCSSYEVGDCVQATNQTGHKWTLCTRTCKTDFCNTGDNHGFSTSAETILVSLFALLAFYTNML
ncbi:uncharacterized protein LOC120330503 [Styela clava]|uniref:uncharacterized protein LOC120330503 n=1 Tax=Styela clava TaxID=7725 RepID=UPI001939EDA4|nr:uncharacterized protein LOC120330503 [Styela clava]